MSPFATSRRQLVKQKPEGFLPGRSTGGCNSLVGPGRKSVILSLAWWGTLRKTGLVVQLTGELTRLSISIAAQSEVCWPGTGSTIVGGYTIYWSGSTDSRHTGGVAIAVAGQYSIHHRETGVPKAEAHYGFLDHGIHLCPQQPGLWSEQRPNLSATVCC